MVIKEIKKILVQHFAEIYDNLRLLGFVEEISKCLSLGSTTELTQHRVVIVHIPKSLVMKGVSNVEVFHKGEGIKLIIFDDRAAQCVVLDDDEHTGDGTEIS